MSSDILGYRNERWKNWITFSVLSFQRSRSREICYAVHMTIEVVAERNSLPTNFIEVDAERKSLPTNLSHM